MRELRGAPELPLAELLGMLAPVDLVLIEGFKRDPIAKIEVYREANGQPLLYPRTHIAALASDGAPRPGLPHAPLDDVAVVAELILEHAEPVEAVVAR